VFNGVQLKLPGCKELACSFPEFDAYVKAVFYSYEDTVKTCNSEQAKGYTRQLDEEFVMAAMLKIS